MSVGISPDELICCIKESASVSLERISAKVHTVGNSGSKAAISGRPYGLHSCVGSSTVAAEASVVP